MPAGKWRRRRGAVFGGGTSEAGLICGGPVGGDADEFETAEVFDGECRRAGWGGDDAARGEMDRLEAFADQSAGSCGGKQVGEADGGLAGAGKRLAGTVSGDKVFDAEVLDVDENGAVG